MSKKNVVISLFMFLTSLTFAQQREPQMDNGEKMGPPPVVENLNLSEEQKDQFKTINLQSEENVVSIKCEIEREQIQLKKELVHSPKLETLLSINNKISKLESDMKTEHIKKWYSIYNILNDEQKKVWIENFRFALERPEIHRRPMRK